ncbi:MAG: hypothetical protein ACLKAK_12945 [Alkaliphilus sp.]
MKIEYTGRAYRIIQTGSGGYQVVMIISEHRTQEEAIGAMLETMHKKEDKQDLRKEGTSAISLEDAIKDMTPKELEDFIDERNRKFITPLFDRNIEELEHKRRRLSIRSLK